MHNFDYVNPKESKAVRDELYKIIHKVQNIVRKNFTFQFKPVGSSSRNMITYDKNSNIGFDFDFDLNVNDDKKDLTPKDIRYIIKNAIDQVAPEYGYTYCEDSTSVLTIKKVNTHNCQIIHSCDFALVHNSGHEKKQYIRFNKKKNNYTWEFQGDEFKNLDRKIKWLKANNYWGELRNYYLKKKNVNNDPAKHSRSIFAESINEMYQKMK